METLGEIIEDARKELREELEDKTWGWHDEDELIDSIADSSVPVYTADLLNVALNNLGLATTEPDLMAFDGENTAVNAIAGNIYEHVREALQNEYEEWEEEQKYKDDEEEEEEEDE